MININFKKAFTLIEVVITATLFFVVVTIVTSLFIDMIKIKWGLDARQNLIKESYYIIEKLQVMSRNYTIDYEEYRNRKKVWCNVAGDNTWSGSSHCTMMTYYGNRNGLWNAIPATDNELYFCSSSVSAPSVLSYSTPVVSDQSLSFPCTPLWITPWSSWFVQSYGQYKSLFTDVKDDVDGVIGAVWDDDDLDLWIWPKVVFQSTGVQELYLISHDRSHRYFLRRKLIEEWDWNNNWITWDNDNEKLYALQVLQLRWLDAWKSHDFQSEGVYDGVIETWACDTSLWFVCSWASVWGAYSSYNLPDSIDDGWVSITPADITISSWNVILSPTQDPLLDWNSAANQISPHIYLVLTTKLYWKSWSTKIPWSQMNLYDISLQTMLWFPSLGKK